MRRLFLSAVAVAGAAFVGTLAPSAAEAAPTLSYRVYQDNVLQGALSVTSTTGQINTTGNTSLFNISGSAFGIGVIAAPSLVGQTTAISSLSSFTGTHTVRIEVTQTDVPSISAGGLFAQLANTLTANILVGSPGVVSVQVSNFADASNVAFAQTNLLAGSTFTAPGNNATPVMVSGVTLPNTLFSETIVFNAVFDGAGASVQASSQIVAVPEPASLALYGMGLLGLGLVRRVRNRKQA